GWGGLSKILEEAKRKEEEEKKQEAARKAFELQRAGERQPLPAAPRPLSQQPKPDPWQRPTLEQLSRPSVDTGTPPISSTQSFAPTVTVENDNEPRFTRPSGVPFVQPRPLDSN